MDVHQGAVLGQHALAYTLLSFLAITMHRRLLWFRLADAGAADPAGLHRRARRLAGRAPARRRQLPGLDAARCAPLFEALLWPVVDLAAARAAAPRARPRREPARSSTASSREVMTELRTSRRTRSLPRAHDRRGGVRAAVLRRARVRAGSCLQVVRHDDLQTQAEDNRIGVVPIVPNRGLIVDRNGVVMATNYSGLHAGDHAVQGGRPRRDDRRARQGDRDRRRATASASSAWSTRARASSRCRSAPSSPTRKWRASRRSASASRASRSRRGCSATIRSASSAAT